MGSIKTVLWDVDATLIDFTASEEQSLRGCFKELGIELTAEQIAAYREINDAYWKKLELGKIEKQRLLLARFEDFLLLLGKSGIDAKSLNTNYQLMLGATAVPNEGALEVCTALRGSVRQYVVSNGTAVAQRNKLANSGLASFMEELFISEEVGFEKPDKRFFEKCFAKIPNFEKECAIVIGDSLTSDIKGANNAGIQCCWYNPDGLLAPGGLHIDYTVKSLLEIPALL